MRILNRVVLVAGFAAGMMACSDKASTLEAIDFTVIDNFAGGIYGQVVESIRTPEYAAKVGKGFNISPAKYQAAMSAELGDGSYRLGKVVYYNVLGSTHAPKIKTTLTNLGHTYKDMGELFQSSDLAKDSRISQKDVRDYFRFTAEFLARGGFRADGNEFYKKWGLSHLVNIARTGIFISQLQGADGNVSFGLDSTSGGGNAGGAAAANGINTWSATKYDDGANSCPAYKSVEASKAANCISPADGSSLWPEACQRNPRGGNPVCGEKHCGEKVKLTTNIGGQSRSVTATVCGACPAIHEENSVTNQSLYPGSGNSCGAHNNIDMTESVYNQLGYSGSTQRQTTSNPGQVVTSSAAGT